MLDLKLFRRWLSDNGVEARYVDSGKDFGDAVSYLYLGEAVNFEELLNRWEFWEAEYSRRGFRTISIDNFEAYGGHGKSISDLLRKPREKDENPILHAKIFRQKYEGKSLNNVIEINQQIILDLKGNPIGLSGTYKPLTTEENER